MLHPLVLVVVMSLVGYDTFGPLWPMQPMTMVEATTLYFGASLTVAIVVHAVMMRCGRALDARGSMRAMRAADAVMAASRILTGLFFVAAVFAMDWIGLVRLTVGDWIGLDEAIACAPPLLMYAAGWWSFYPIDRRLHDATMLRALDTGRTVHAMPTRIGYTWEKVRYSMMAALAPLALILLWSEASAQIVERWNVLPWPLDDDRALLTMAAAQLLGAAVVLIVSPVILLGLWDTAPLPHSDLRDRLESMGRRHGVRFSGIRIWRTRGLILNGAVLGVLPPLRFVLLTDALIENLPADQLDAVMAHEIGHVRRRHLPWLLATLATALGLATFAGTYAAGWIAIGGSVSAAALDAGAFLFAIITGLVVFGFVSRLFERQADAFAAQDASGMTRRNGGRGVTITPEAAQSMAGALERVARLNHIPIRKFTWRHGSIANRCDRIRRLIGLPAGELAVDRISRLVRWSVAGGLTLLFVATLWDARRWAEATEGSTHTTARHIDDSLYENARHRE